MQKNGNMSYKLDTINCVNYKCKLRLANGFNGMSKIATVHLYVSL